MASDWDLDGSSSYCTTGSVIFIVQLAVLQLAVLQLAVDHDAVDHDAVLQLAVEVLV
jgi:hypothetical protein